MSGWGGGECSAKLWTCKQSDQIRMREEGVEPSRLAAQEPKSCVSANSTTLAYQAPAKESRISDSPSLPRVRPRTFFGFFVSGLVGCILIAHEILVHCCRFISQPENEFRLTLPTFHAKLW